MDAIWVSKISNTVNALSNSCQRRLNGKHFPKEKFMQTIELKKQYKSLYMPSAKKPTIVDVPTLKFLMIDGAIEPNHEPGNSPLFEENMQAMYGIAYTLKFMLKKRTENPVDYPVMALEGLWWVEDGNFDITIKDNWYYTLMILVPDLLTSDDFSTGLEQLRKKKGTLPAFDRLRRKSFTEGLCVQMMHIGSYASEPATLEIMQAFMAETNLQDQVGPTGKHHEIYLGDPRRAAPEKLKTVLRHPVSS